MGRHRAVESKVQQRNVQDVRSRHTQSRSGHDSRYVISRPYSSQSSSLPQSPRTATLASRLTQLKVFSADVSRSVVRYPFRWLGVTWLVLIGVGSVAAVTLFKINSAELAESSSSATVSAEHSASSDQSQSTVPTLASPSDSSLGDQSPVPSQQKESLPLFALGSVAFSCAIGCLWLSYRFRSGPSKPQTHLLTGRQRLPRPSATAQRATKATVSSVPTAASIRSSQETAPAPSVAIVPDSENHPLDWQEPSLADNLDIRQQRPLSRWL